MRRGIAVAVAGLLVLGVLGATGCRRVPIERVDGKRTTTHEEFALGGDEAARIELMMGAGELRLGSDAATGTALVADFDFRPARWAPEVSQTTEGTTTVISIRQPDRGGIDLGPNMTNEWNLQLAKGLPTALSVRLGAGTGDLSLGGSGVRQLSVEMGAGDCTVDLSGEWLADMNAEIEAGVGELTLIVPEGVGVRVDASEEGIGETRIDGLRRSGGYYVNDAYGNSAVTLDIRVRKGVGEVDIRTAR